MKARCPDRPRIRMADRTEELKLLREGVGLRTDLVKQLRAEVALRTDLVKLNREMIGYERAKEGLRFDRVKRVAVIVGISVGVLGLLLRAIIAFAR